MKLYLAPMEGITSYIYRNALEKYFPGTDRYSHRLSRRTRIRSCARKSEEMCFRRITGCRILFRRF